MRDSDENKTFSGKPIGDREPNTGNLIQDRIMAIFAADLRHRSADFKVPSYPLADTVWILLLQRIYANSAGSCGKQ
jgi:hypothetical protein